MLPQCWEQRCWQMYLLQNPAPPLSLQFANSVVKWSILKPGASTNFRKCMLNHSITNLIPTFLRRNVCYGNVGFSPGSRLPTFQRILNSERSYILNQRIQKVWAYKIQFLRKWKSQLINLRWATSVMPHLCLNAMRLSQRDIIEFDDVVLRYTSSRSMRRSTCQFRTSCLTKCCYFKALTWTSWTDALFTLTTCTPSHQQYVHASFNLSVAYFLFDEVLLSSQLCVL